MQISKLKNVFADVLEKHSLFNSQMKIYFFHTSREIIKMFLASPMLGQLSISKLRKLQKNKRANLTLSDKHNLNRSCVIPHA